MCSAKQQDLVDSYFRSRARVWKEIYEREDVDALIHQRRRSIVLRLIDNLGLPQESPILEVGCGAGLTTVALADRGHAVHAIDSVQETDDTEYQRAFRPKRIDAANPTTFSDGIRFLAFKSWTS